MTALPIALMSDDEVARFGQVTSASEQGFGALSTARGPLPLTAMEIDAHVAGVVASIDVEQTFVNTLRTPIEATYIFPLPDRAAVHRFQMTVNGRVVDGVVEERGAAREQYDEAIAAGHRAAITEEERAGVFTLRVGNLMPGETAVVKLSLVGPLPVDDGEVTFRFPLVVAPRYMPGHALEGEQSGLGSALDTSQVPDASRISPPRLLKGCPNPVRLGIRVALADHHITDVASSLHAISETKQDARVIALANAERVDQTASPFGAASGQTSPPLDRDFVLRWKIAGAALTSSLACADDADGKGGTFLLTLVPPSTTALGTKPRDVVFVIDRSGSMDGWKMVAARRAAARMIDTLTSRDRFCAIAFDNQPEGVPSLELLPATDRNRYRAVEALAKVDARGGTELAAPLELACTLTDGGHDDRERVIVLVTDGQVGNEDSLLKMLAPRLRGRRMFTLGIDQAVNAAFLRRLAAAGGGLCELVESEDRLDAVMAKVHRRIGMPVATELSLAFEGLDAQRDTISPAKLPDVYAGAPVTVVGRYAGTAKSDAVAHVMGTSTGEPLKMNVVATVAPAGPTPWLAPSWARARIRDLEDRYATGERSVESTIVTTSKTYGVLSRFTAFLAIDRSEVVNRGGHIRQVVQAVEMPGGWDGSLGSAAAMPMSMPVPMPQAGYAPPAMPGRSLMKSMMGVHRGAPAMPSAPMGGSFGGPPMSPPPPPAKVALPRVAAPEKREKSDEGRAAEPRIADAYLQSLALLASELAAQAAGRADAQSIRVLRQRLGEWIEDVRSTGAGMEIAAEVERLVHRLTAALAGTAVAAETVAVAMELAKLASGAAVPPEPTKKSRLAFWK